MRRLKMAIIVAVIISSLMTGPVLAKLALNTIDDNVILSSNDRQLLVTGPIACTQGEQVTIDIVVTQRSTGAIAKGSFRDFCVGENTIQNWQVNANTVGSNTFEEGTALTWAVATTRDHNTVTDVRQWAKEVNVIRQT